MHGYIYNLEQYTTITDIQLLTFHLLVVFILTMHFSQAFLDACKTGNVGVVLELLECGADHNQADKVRGSANNYG